MNAPSSRFRSAPRKSIDTATDPYMPRKSASSVGACTTCHSLRRNKRWYLDEKEYKALARKPGGFAPERCPACRKIAHRFPFGVVQLRGSYLREHRGEIIRLIRNEERRAMGINPLERIISLTEENETMEITTTDEKLAQRIGREVRKACQGALEYKWSEDAKLVRVVWAREA